MLAHQPGGGDKKVRYRDGAFPIIFYKHVYSGEVAVGTGATDDKSMLKWLTLHASSNAIREDASRLAICSRLPPFSSLICKSDFQREAALRPRASAGGQPRPDHQAEGGTQTGTITSCNITIIFILV